MVFITSISPDRIDIQKRAIESWLKTGSVVFSLNIVDELNTLKPIYSDVIFIETNPIKDNYQDTCYVKINTLLDVAYNQNYSDTICLINSDIELSNNKNYFNQFEERAKQGLVYVSRYDYDLEDKSDIHKTAWGIDVFAMSKQTTRIFPINIFSIGQPVWDYWLPYTALKKNIPLTYINKPFAYHKQHEKKWNNQQWKIMIEAFKEENKITGVNRAISRMIRKNFIENSSILELNY